MVDTIDHTLREAVQRRRTLTFVPRPGRLGWPPPLKTKRTWLDDCVRGVLLTGIWGLTKGDGRSHKGPSHGGGPARGAFGQKTVARVCYGRQHDHQRHSLGKDRITLGGPLGRPFSVWCSIFRNALVAQRGIGYLPNGRGKRHSRTDQDRDRKDNQVMNMRTTATASLTLLALAACTAEESQQFADDPGGFACRERAVTAAGVSFAETSERPINRDINGIGNYDIYAGGRTYRCTVDANNIVIAFVAV